MIVFKVLASILIVVTCIVVVVTAYIRDGVDFGALDGGLMQCEQLMFIFGCMFEEVLYGGMRKNFVELENNVLVVL